ncbi:MAG: glycosyltransferase [Planctomycetes bacterium]|nr:glycosyltransferase [Planctomycetota bacterium]
MSEKQQSNEKVLLVFNCHEPWVYQLDSLGYKLDIIIGLKGRYQKTWDQKMRPVPTNSNLLTLEEAQNSKTNYYCIITHNLTDLLDVKHRHEPRLIVLHSTLEGRISEETGTVESTEMRNTLQEYLTLLGGHAVAGTDLKAKSWQITDDVVNCGVDVNDYLPYSGQDASGLRICNFIENRKKILLWDLHEKAFSDIPVKLLGHNPAIPDSTAAENWDDLKRTLQSHRFFIHTAAPNLEDGFNMAVMEAMATGMPILGNHHRSSPIEHGVNGFLSDDPDELNKYAKILLNDRELAAKMGQQARVTVAERFPISKFKQGLLKSIETARQKTKSRMVNL